MSKPHHKRGLLRPDISKLSKVAQGRFNSLNADIIHEKRLMKEKRLAIKRLIKGKPKQ